MRGQTSSQNGYRSRGEIAGNFHQKFWLVWGICNLSSQTKFLMVERRGHGHNIRNETSIPNCGRLGYHSGQSCSTLRTAETQRFHICGEPDARVQPRASEITNDPMLVLREYGKQITQIGFICGIVQQRRDAENLLKRAQRGAVGVMDAVGIAGAFGKR